MAKILVIDDDISLLQLIKNALEYDHSITTYTGLSSVSIREINKHDSGQWHQTPWPQAKEHL